jgi:hypothetical protein
MRVFAFALSFILAGLAGCGQKAEPLEVSQETFLEQGKVWPLSVQSGQVGCVKNAQDPRAEARWFRAPDGKLYGLNGFATSDAGYEDITPIWLEDIVRNRQLQEAFPDQTVTIRNRLSLGDLMEEAAKGC